MSGTFVTHSWDVMEPLSYVMMLGNFTVGMLFYAVFKEEMQLTTLQEMVARRFAKGLYRRRGVDLAVAEELEKEIKELREILNKSIY